MRVNRTSLLSFGFVVLSFILTAVFYSRLPAAVPTHWNLSGQADGFTSKPWGPFVLPLVTAGVLLLFLAIPRISPRGFRTERFARVLEIIQAATMGFFFLATVLALVAGVGGPVPMHRAIPAATGVLLAVIGNFMGKLTKNFFVGIRTPWTLASDEVWARTHRLGGRLFVLAGAVVLVSALLGGGWAPPLAALVIAAGVPVIYSYVIYRRLEGFKDRSDPDGADEQRDLDRGTR